MSNARFAKKDLKLNYNTIEALEKFIDSDRKVTVCKPAKRTKNGYTVSKVKLAKG